jgi:hypothetical protein
MSTVNFIDSKKLLIAVFVSTGFYAIGVHADNILSCDAENTAITATTTHLTDNNDGTITDPETGLIWKKCSEGQSWSTAGNNCSGTENTYTWAAALQRAQSVNTGSGENFSQTDWRLPNVKELASIAELRCEAPAINNTVFPNTPSAFFWSSSAYAPSSNLAWDVNFSSGGDGASNKSGSGFVRLVRSGQ